MEQNLGAGWGGTIKPNLIYDKHSIYNQREEDGLFSKLERKDKENIAKVLRCENMHGASPEARNSHDWREGGVGAIERNDVEKVISEGPCMFF